MIKVMKKCVIRLLICQMREPDSQWAWSGSRKQFLHCGLRKFRHNKSSDDDDDDRLTAFDPGQPG